MLDWIVVGIGTIDPFYFEKWKLIHEYSVPFKYSGVIQEYKEYQILISQVMLAPDGDR